MTREQIFEFFRRLAELNPAPETELEFGNAFQLVVAVAHGGAAENAEAGVIDEIFKLDAGRGQGTLRGGSDISQTIRMGTLFIRSGAWKAAFELGDCRSELRR